MPELHVLQRLRMIVESSPETDMTGSLASFVDVPIREGTAAVELQMTEVDPQTQGQSRLSWRKLLPCKRTATLNFTMNLAPTGTIANASTAATQGALGKILKACMGGERLGQGDTASTGSTSSVINVTTGARWVAGGIMGWTNAAGVVEWRPIESVSSNVVTLKKAFSGAPANADVLYSAATYYFTETPDETMQFLAAGRESDDRWLLLNGQVTSAQIALDPAAGDCPTIAFTVEFTNWIASDETLVASITGDIGTASYTGYSPIVGCGGELRVWTVGTATHSSDDEIDASAIEFAPTISWIKKTSPSGDRWVPGRAGPPVTGGFTTPFEGLTWWNARKNSTDKAFWFAQGHAAGAAIVYDAPTVQIVAPQRAADGAGIAADVVQWQGRPDEDVGSSTTELAKSPARIHLC